MICFERCSVTKQKLYVLYTLEITGLNWPLLTRVLKGAKVAEEEEGGRGELGVEGAKDAGREAHQAWNRRRAAAGGALAPAASVAACGEAKWRRFVVI